MSSTNSGSTPRPRLRADKWCVTRLSRCSRQWRLAKQAGDPVAAQLVAAECVVDAETKDHANWELIGKVVEEGDRR